MHLKNLIKAAIAEYERTREWPTLDGDRLDRRSVITASEAASCPRKLYYEKVEAGQHDVEPREMGMAYRGDAVEAWFVDWLEQALPEIWSIELHGIVQRSIISDDGEVSGTPDGWLLNHGNEVIQLLEVKSFDPRSNPSNFPRPAHVLQCQINDMLLRMSARNRRWFQVATGVDLRDFVFARPKLVYINSNDALDIHEFEVAEKFDCIEHARDKLRSIKTAANAGEVEPLGMTTGECQWCPFKEACDAAGVPGLNDGPVRRDMPDFLPRGVAAHIRRYAEAKARADELNRVMDEAGSAIKASMVTAARAEIEAGGYVAKITKVAGRKTLDVPAYAAATGVDPAPFYKTGKPSVRLEVKPNNEAEGN